MTKPMVIRCPGKRKSAREERCGRFLAQIDTHSIRVVCPSCGGLHLITRNPFDGYSVEQINANENPLITASPQLTQTQQKE